MMPLIYGAPAVSMEVSARSKLAQDGWSACLARMECRANELGAEGIVGVVATRKLVKAESRAEEFMLSGTAVKGLTGDRLWHSRLVPSQILAILTSGFAPQALVIGCCAWHESAWRFKPKRTSLGSWANQEIPDLTQGIYTARSIAMQRIQDQAMAVHAAGVVGVTYDSDVRADSDSSGTGMLSATCEFTVYGSAVVRAGSRAQVDAVFTLPLGESI